MHIRKRMYVIVCSLLSLCLLITGCSTPLEDFEAFGSILEDTLQSFLNSSSSSESISNTPQEALTGLDVYFLDVGQADCTLLRTSNKTVLIDGGNRGDAEDIIFCLDSLGVSYLDVVIATHPHEDHIGGLPKILEEFEVGTMYMPYVEEEYIPTTKIYETLLTTILDNNIEALVPERDEVILTDGDGELEIKCLYDGYLGEKDYNTYSIAVLVTYGNTKFILAGDADKEVELDIMSSYADTAFLDCDVFKASHHGSRTANSIEWLEVIKPEIVVIPCETNNSYGHPHQEALGNFTAIKASLYDMSTAGTVLIKSNGIQLAVYEGLTGEYPLGNKNFEYVFNMVA